MKREKMEVKVLTDKHRKIIVDVEGLRRLLKPTLEVFNGDLNQYPADSIGWWLHWVFKYAELVAKRQVNIINLVPATAKGHFRKNQITVIAETDLRCSDLGTFDTNGLIQLAVVEVSELDSLKYDYDVKVNELNITEEECERHTIAIFTAIEKGTKQKPLTDMQSLLNSFYEIPA